METLIREVKEVIRLEGLDQKDRRRHVIHARMYLMNLLRRHEIKLIEIGAMFNLDHSTVVHALNKYEELEYLNDKILIRDTKNLRDIFEVKYSTPKFSIVYDVNNATTQHDFRVIQSRMEQGVYSDVNYK
jgi:hypothetical protein